MGIRRARLHKANRLVREAEMMLNAVQEAGLAEASESEAARFALMSTIALAHAKIALAEAVVAGGEWDLSEGPETETE